MYLTVKAVCAPAPSLFLSRLIKIGSAAASPSRFFFTLSMLFMVTSSVHAVDRTWLVSSGTWSTSENWSGSVAPTSSDLVTINNSGTSLLPFTVSGSYNELRIGTAPGGSGAIVISGGVLSASGFSRLGYSPDSTGNATVSNGIWAAIGGLQVGTLGTGNLQINGGVVTSLGGGGIGDGPGGTGNVTVSSGTWAISDNLSVGNLGAGSLLINGGRVSNNRGTIGGGSAASGSVTVTGQGSIWVNTGSLTVGRQGSNNTLAIEDGGLVKVGDSSGETIAFSTNGGTNNYLRLDGGYLALFGDQYSYVGSLITAGRIQLWDGSQWVTSTESEDFDYAYFATDAAAEEFSGYSGLGGYTIITGVPEPGTCGLIALGLGALLLRRKRRTE